MHTRGPTLGGAWRRGPSGPRVLDGLAERPVGATASVEELHGRLARPLTEDPRTVIADLAADAETGLTASAGPRYFGFVVGGALPAAVAADWLVAAWDQNGNGALTAPGRGVAEAVAGDWVLELLGLPRSCGVGFVTGCQTAHVTCLAAARHAVLADAGWNVEADGLQGAPELRVVAGAHAHVTIARACRILGLGAAHIRVVPSDHVRRMIATELGPALREHHGPTIVCAQAGQINSGPFDPLERVVETCREHGAWCHVDGAFGLWGAVSPSRRVLLDGFRQADSWATDGHKWLNVPYDCGIAVVADAARQRIAMAATLNDIPPTTPTSIWTSDRRRSSRATRGRSRCTPRCARSGATVSPTSSTAAAMRISVSGWQTTAADVDRCADAILAALRAVIDAT